MKHLRCFISKKLKYLKFYEPHLFIICILPLSCEMNNILPIPGDNTPTSVLYQSLFAFIQEKNNMITALERKNATLVNKLAKSEQQTKCALELAWSIREKNKKCKQVETEEIPNVFGISGIESGNVFPRSTEEIPNVFGISGIESGNVFPRSTEVEKEVETEVEVMCKMIVHKSKAEVRAEKRLSDNGISKLQVLLPNHPPYWGVQVEANHKRKRVSDEGTSPRKTSRPKPDISNINNTGVPDTSPW
jgi:hypothetical protein